DGRQMGVFGTNGEKGVPASQDVLAKDLIATADSQVRLLEELLSDPGLEQSDRSQLLHQLAQWQIVRREFSQSGS
ncbi:MAG: hypothetical protein N2578_06540, partial [Bdellovibrionaceae bacterium]|nr:hypothetical protein [Pseudobdellovibrionaceae bacterium]